MTSMRVRTDDIGGLTVADVMHEEFETMAPADTVGRLREWFAGSASRRLAIIADRGLYVGSLTRAEVEGEMRALRPVAELVRTGCTLAPTQMPRPAAISCSEPGRVASLSSTAMGGSSGSSR